MNVPEAQSSPDIQAVIRNDKGQFITTGNPAGRPKKPDCLISLLKEELEKIPEGSTQTNAQQIAIALIKMAKAENIRAIKELFDRVYGMARQTVDIGNSDGPFCVESRISELSTEDLTKLLEIAGRLESSDTDV